jgi:hypothetical protein
MSGFMISYAGQALKRETDNGIVTAGDDPARMTVSGKN